MHKTGDVLFLIVVVALAYVVVRPGSQAASVIGAIGNGFAGAIASATGQASPRRPRQGRQGGQR
jgi:hypothetical protein